MYSGYICLRYTQNAPQQHTHTNFPPDRSIFATMFLLICKPYLVPVICVWLCDKKSSTELFLLHVFLVVVVFFVFIHFTSFRLLLSTLISLFLSLFLRLPVCIIYIYIYISSRPKKKHSKKQKKRKGRRRNEKKTKL